MLVSPLRERDDFIIMQSDTFEIAYNEEQLEYYSYLRESLEASEIDYWMGNPSVQITNGSIHLVVPPLGPLNQNLDSV